MRVTCQLIDRLSKSRTPAPEHKVGLRQTVKLRRRHKGNILPDRGGLQEPS